MAEQSLLARLGLRLAVLGSAANLMIAAPLSNGDPSMAAHTDATRIGMYATRATNNGILGIVVGGVETLDVQGDGATTWIGIPTASQPALSPANKGSLYYDDTVQGFMASYNGGAYAPFGAGGISGLTAGRVPFAASATTLTDAAALTYSVAHGLSNQRSVGPAGNEMFGLDAGNTTMGGARNTFVGNSACALNTSSDELVAVGYHALGALIASPRNVAVGAFALSTLAGAGGDNVAVGHSALLNAQTFTSNCTAIGSQASGQSTTATNNTAVGSNAGYNTTTGSHNTFLGVRAGYTNGTGQFIVAIGSGAFNGTPADTTQNGIVAVGYSALNNSSGGPTGSAKNTAIGYQAGQFNTSGAANIFLGYDAGDSSPITTSGQFVAGSLTAPLSSVWFGNGAVAASPQAITINSTGGSGADVAGASLTLAGGTSTGAGAGGAVAISTSPATGSSSTPNTQTTRLTVGGDGGVKWTGIATTSQPATSGANNGTIYYDSTSQAFFASVNNGAYAAFGGSGITGLTAGRVTVASSSTTINDFAAMTYSTAHGLSVNRAIGVPTTTNEMFGFDAGNATMGSSGVTIVGHGAGTALVSGSDNTLVGATAGAALTLGSRNSVLGSNALPVLVTANDNTAIGASALQRNTGGANNTAIGSGALHQLVTGANNVAVGINALGTMDISGIGGSEMTAIGSSAMSASTPSSLRDVAVGFQALSVSGQPIDCVAVGWKAGLGLSAQRVTLVGSSAMMNAGGLGTDDNTAIGANTGANITTGSSNIFLGSGAGDSTVDSTSSHFVVGSVVAPITTVFVGNGETATAPQAVTWNGTGGSGSNVTGAAMTLAGGRGTGTGPGGALIYQTSPAGTTGTALNALVTRWTIGADGGTQWTGIATTSAPALSGANNGTIYYDSTSQAFLLSSNGGAYAPIGTGSGNLSGTLTAGRVPYASGAHTLVDITGFTFDGANLAVPGSLTAGSILDVAGRGGVGAAGLPGTHDNVRFTIGGSQVPFTTGVIEYGMVMICDITGNPNQNIVGGMIRPASMVKAASGTHPLMVNWLLTPPVASPSGAASVTDTAMLYISGVFAETVSGTNYALWQGSTGKSRFDGNVDLNGNSANQSSILTCRNASAGAYGTLFAEGASGDGVTDWANSFVIEAVPATSGNLVLGAYTGQIVFQTSARASIARFTAGGTLLIGTATDDLTNLLQVNGGIRTRATTDSTSATTGALISSGGFAVALSTNFGVATQWTGIATVSAPSLSTSNNGKIYYDRTSQAFFASLNGGAYAAFGGGNLTGSLTTTRVPFASGASALTDSAQMVFSTADGLSVNRGIAGALRCEMFGLDAGNTTLTGNNNTAVGNGAGNSLSSGSSNTLLGMQAGNFQATTTQCVAVGDQALLGNSTPANNTGTQITAIGSQALKANTSGGQNVAVGTNTSRLSTTAGDNTIVGALAGANVTTGGQNTFVGSNAGGNQQAVVGLVAVGYQALLSTIGSATGTQCTAVGTQTLLANTTGSNNTALGFQAGTNLTTGGTNTFLGALAGANQLTIASQVAVGYQALQGNATPSNNTGVANTAVGYQALLVNSTGLDNTAVGYLAGTATTTGGFCTFIGAECGKNNTAGSNNTGVGYGSAQYSSTNSANNVSVGTSTLNQVSSSTSRNTALGNSALSGTGSNFNDNVAIGNEAFKNVSTGSQNIFIGSFAGSNTPGGSANRAVFGSDSAPATDVWFGRGDLSATATTYTIHGTDGLGADKVGGQLTLAGGRSTGAGTAASIVFQTAPASGSSSTLNTLATQFTIDPKGNLVCGNAAIATGATDGFLYLVSCAGTPSGTPTTFTGRVPIILDTTGGKFWAYYGGAWHFALLT